MKKNNWQVINCRTCGYWHVHPMPSSEELRSYYADKYYRKLKSNRSMSDKLNDLDGFYALQYQDRLAVIEQLISPLLPRKILDIGAGYGDFIRSMANNGWHTQGFEISKDAYSTIRDRRRLGVKQGAIEEISNMNFSRVSVVTLNNVLEHLREPMKILTVIRDRFLLKGGIVMIIVPNDFSPLQDILMKTVLKNNPKKKYYWLAPPEHLNYWSVFSFKRFARKCGFKVLSVVGDFPMELFPLMGEDYISHPYQGRKAHLKRVVLEKNIAEAGFQKLKSDLFRSFASLGMGRDVQFFLKPYSF